MDESELDAWFEKTMQYGRDTVHQEMKARSRDDLKLAAEFIGSGDDGVRWPDVEDRSRREWEHLTRDEKMQVHDELREKVTADQESRWKLHFWMSRYWPERYGETALAEPANEVEPDGGWAAGSFAVDVTLPDGSRYTESDAGSSIDGAWVQADDVEKSPRWWETRKGVTGLVAGSLAGVVAIGVIALMAGSGDSDGAEVVEPVSPPVTTLARPTTLAPTTTIAATTTTAPTTTLVPTTTVAGQREANTPSGGAKADPRSTVKTMSTSNGSLVFSVTVQGDGESWALSPSTKWYMPIFTFETSDGTELEVQGDWGRAKPFEGVVYDESFNPLDGYTVDGVWAASDEFVITVDAPTLAPGLPAEVELEILVRVEDADGISTDYGDQYTWTP